MAFSKSSPAGPIITRSRQWRCANTALMQPTGQRTHLLDYWPRQDVRRHLTFEPLSIRRAPQQSPTVDDDFAAQDRHYGIPLATETFPDAVIGIGVEIVHGQGLVEIGINEHEIRVTARGNNAFLRVEPED